MWSLFYYNVAMTFILNNNNNNNNNNKYQYQKTVYLYITLHSNFLSGPSMNNCEKIMSE